MASSIATPLERQFGHIAGVTEMTSSSTSRHHQRHAAVRSEPRHQRRGARRGGGHQRGAHLPSREPAGESDLSQSEPRRFAHPGAGPAIGRLRRPDALRRSVHRDRAAHLADFGRRRGAGGGSIAARRAHRAESRTSLPATASVCRRCSRSWPARIRTRRKASSPTATSTADILANDQISKAVDYKPLVVGYHNGGVVRLQDVADVVDSQQTVRQAGFLNGKPSVNMLIFRQPGANIITTVDAVKAAIPRCRPPFRAASIWSRFSTARSPSAPRFPISSAR